MVEPQWHSRIHTNLVQNQDQWHNDSTSLMVCLAFFMTTRHKNLLKNAEKGAKLANGQFSLAQLLKKKPILNHLLKHLFTLLNGVHALLLGPCNTVREHPSIHFSYPNTHTICSKC